MTVRVPAKVNLQLSVGPLRPDGFHELATVFQAVGLLDEVVARNVEAVNLDLVDAHLGLARVVHQVGQPGGRGSGGLLWDVRLGLRRLATPR